MPRLTKEQQKELDAEHARFAPVKAATILRRDIVSNLLKSNKLSPLEIMWNYMHEAAAAAEVAKSEHRAAEDQDVKAAWHAIYKENASQAVDIAFKCAPYIHPKLTATTVSGTEDGPPVKLEMFSPAEALKSMVRGMAS